MRIPPAEDPAIALAAVLAMRREAEKLERAAVAKALSDGWTWEQIARVLEVSRQAAHKKHAGQIRKSG